MEIYSSFMTLVTLPDTQVSYIGYSNVVSSSTKEYRHAEKCSIAAIETSTIFQNLIVARNSQSQRKAIEKESSIHLMNEAVLGSGGAVLYHCSDFSYEHMGYQFSPKR